MESFLINMSVSKEFKDRVSNMVLVPKSLYEKCLNHLDNEVRDLASSVNIRQFNNFCKSNQPDKQKWGLARNDILEKINIKYIDKEGNHRNNKSGQMGSQGEVNIENVNVSEKKNLKKNEKNIDESGQTEHSHPPQSDLPPSSDPSMPIQDYPTLLQNQPPSKKYVSEVRPKLATDLVDPELTSTQQQNNQPNVTTPPEAVGSIQNDHVTDDRVGTVGRSNVVEEKENTIEQVQQLTTDTPKISSVQDDDGDNNNLQQTDEFSSNEEVSSENVLNHIIPKLSKSQFSRLKWQNAPPLTQSYHQVKRLANKQIKGLKNNENNFRAQLRNHLRKEEEEDLKKKSIPIKDNDNMTIVGNNNADLAPLTPKIVTKETVQKEHLTPAGVKTELDMLDDQKLSDLNELVQDKKEEVYRYEHLLRGVKAKQFKRGLDNTGKWKKRHFSKKLGQARMDYIKLLDIYNDVLDEKIADQEKKRKQLLANKAKSHKVKVEVIDDDQISSMEDLEKKKKMVEKKMQKVKVFDDDEVSLIKDIVQKKKGRKRKSNTLENEEGMVTEKKKLKKNTPVRGGEQGKEKLKVKVVNDNKVSIVKDIMQPKKGIKRKQSDSENEQNSRRKVAKSLGTRKRKAIDEGELESSTKKKKKKIITVKDAI